MSTRNTQRANPNVQPIHGDTDAGLVGNNGRDDLGLTDPDAMDKILAEYHVLREAIQVAPSAYCVYDAQDRLVIANTLYEELNPIIRDLRDEFGQSRPITYRDVAARHLRGTVPAEEFDQALETRVREQRNADGRAVERTYWNGQRYRIFKYPLPSGGTAGIAIDITELKNREAELMTAMAASEAASAQASAALTLEKSRKYNARAMAELGEWLQSCKSLDELYVVIRRFMRVLFPDTDGTLFIYSNSRDVLDSACTWGASVEPNLHIHPDECWALRRGRILRFGAGLVDVPCGHVHDLGPNVSRPYVCVPIVAHGDTVGLLHIRMSVDHDFQDEDGATGQALLIQCAEQISLAIANVRLRDELQDQSSKDPLTGLYNRRHFMNQFRRRLGPISSSDNPVALICLDADNFKALNDVSGHDAGDLVLCELSDMLRKNVPDKATVARFGGEEFSILMPDTSLEAAVTVAESLREKAAQLRTQYAGKPLRQVTISLGVAVNYLHGQKPADLLRAADLALYAAKDGGRDKVCVARTAASATDPGAAQDC
jgi:diguanylate cyclase (GGDEF)-like protein